MDDVTTRLIEMPTGICGYTIKDEDGNYTVFLNCRMSHERQLEAYNHELKHINNDDFYKRGSAGLIEIYAHSI